jgi:hypothetical protein
MQVDHGSGRLTTLLTTTEALNGKGKGLTSTRLTDAPVYILSVEYPQNSGQPLRASAEC